ncbi:hypothetical protein Tco_1289430 [Tanacetum coccineum]
MSHADHHRHTPQMAATKRSTTSKRGLGHGISDFGLWRVKMRALLIQHRCEAALKVLPADMEAKAKAELDKKAYSAMILCLCNKVLREVTGRQL